MQIAEWAWTPAPAPSRCGDDRDAVEPFRIAGPAAGGEGAGSQTLPDPEIVATTAGDAVMPMSCAVSTIRDAGHCRFRAATERTVTDLMPLLAMTLYTVDTWNVSTSNAPLGQLAAFEFSSTSVSVYWPVVSL